MILLRTWSYIGVVKDGDDHSEYKCSVQKPTPLEETFNSQNDIVGKSPRKLQKGYVIQVLPQLSLLE